LDLRRENPARQRMGFACFVGVAAPPSTLLCHMSQDSDHRGQDFGRDSCNAEQLTANREPFRLPRMVLPTAGPTDPDSFATKSAPLEGRYTLGDANRCGGSR
jgi:hypothetical protein